MSTNLKTKEENWTREEVAVLLEEVEKNEAYLFETAPIHRDKDDFERPWTSPHTSWKLPVAKKRTNCKAAENWTIDCMVYVWWVLLCRSGAMAMPMATNPIYRPDGGGTWQ